MDTTNQPASEPRTIAVAGATGALGHHVVDIARARGHRVVPLSRSTGHDVTTGAGVAAAIEGADAVIDVANVATTSGDAATEFFRRVTRTLRRVEKEVGVPHHVTLSIVGIDGVEDGYYAGKLAHEAELRASGAGWTLLRAAQFHEFAGQTLGSTTFGPIAVLPSARIRPIAAREVAAALVELAEGEPSGRVRDLVGPRDERLASVGRRLLRHRGKRTLVLEVPLPGSMGRALRSGALRGGPDARHGSQTFDEWLAAGGAAS